MWLMAGLLLTASTSAARRSAQSSTTSRYSVGFGIAGLSLAAVFRNQAGAIVTALVWPLVIEVIG